VFFISLAFVSFFILRLASRPGGLEQLFTAKSTYGRRWGSLYDVLHENKLNFIVLNNVASLVCNAIIGFGHRSGKAQVGTLIVLELSMCIGKWPPWLRMYHTFDEKSLSKFKALYRYRPYYSQGYNRVHYMLAATKTISQVLHIPFIHQIATRTKVVCKRLS
jgi:hypothetical protein